MNAPRLQGTLKEEGDDGKTTKAEKEKSEEVEVKWVTGDGFYDEDTSRDNDEDNSKNSGTAHDPENFAFAAGMDNSAFEEETNDTLGGGEVKL